MTDQNRPETQQEAGKSESSEGRMMVIAAVVGTLLLLGIMGAGWVFQHPATPAVDTEASAQSRQAPSE
jgi:hypothetical protein